MIIIGGKVAVTPVRNKVMTLITPGLNQDPDDTQPLPDYSTIN